MRVMVDTNGLLSALIFPHGVTAQAFFLILKDHSLILPTYVIAEGERVILKKFPSFELSFRRFIRSLSFELATTPAVLKGDEGLMRDRKDIPILLSALKENVDCFVTGDKDFLSLKMVRPEFLTSGEFLQKYGK